MAELTAGDEVVGRVYHRALDPNNGDNHVDAFLLPRAGTWTVTLEAKRVTSGRFDAWLERDEACGTCQARFTAGDADPASTTGTIANGRLPLVVGAYDAHEPDRPPAAFTSRGPTRDHRCKPDVAGPGKDILAARSAPRGSRRSPGGAVRKSGSSMATPHVTGAVALCLEAGGHRLDSAAHPGAGARHRRATRRAGPRPARARLPRPGRAWSPQYGRSSPSPQQATRRRTEPWNPTSTPSPAWRSRPRRPTASCSTGPADTWRVRWTGASTCWRDPASG